MVFWRARQNTPKDELGKPPTYEEIMTNIIHFSSSRALQHPL